MRDLKPWHIARGLCSNLWNSWMENFKKSLRALKSELAALYFAYRDPRTPWYAKVAAILVIAYALSPIDLIPDFIPVLGYLDDLIILPLGIFFAIKLIPAEIMASAREKAASSDQALPTGNCLGDSYNRFPLAGWPGFGRLVDLEAALEGIRISQNGL